MVNLDVVRLFDGYGISKDKTIEKWLQGAAPTKIHEGANRDRNL